MRRGERDSKAGICEQGHGERRDKGVDISTQTGYLSDTFDLSVFMSLLCYYTSRCLFGCVFLFWPWLRFLHIHMNAVLIVLKFSNYGLIYEHHYLIDRKSLLFTASPI